MNDLETRHTGDDELLDRLVDGELNETERRALLEDFDRRSDGWRRCALAFLEAQTFGTVLREHVTAPAEPALSSSISSSSYTAVPYVAPRKSGVEWPRFLAAAASFLIACTAIMWYRGTLNRPVADPLPNVASTMPPKEMLSLTMDGDRPNTQRTVQLPMIQGRSLDALLRQPASVLPQNVVQELERRGHVVQQQRQLVPVQLQDGRRAVIPVDQVELRYVGERGYQ